MKKLFLLVPVGLVAGSGWLLYNTESLSDQTQTKQIEIASKTPEQLFSLSQDSLRLIVRHGDGRSIPILEKSVDELEKVLAKYEKQGLAIQATEKLISQYKTDSIALSKATLPNLEKLQMFDHSEESGEEKFLLAINQIGLYELQTAYKKMDKIRLDYLKEPTDDLEIQYRIQNEKVHEMIRELYLDANIEEPLFAYINNHRGYFETVATNYKKAGLERVLRLRENSYAIKTELQMLPNI